MSTTISEHVSGEPWEYDPLIDVERRLHEYCPDDWSGIRVEIDVDWKLQTVGHSVERGNGEYGWVYTDADEAISGLINGVRNTIRSNEYTPCDITITIHREPLTITVEDYE